MIIVPTGYMGSGSSAITDLISEFDGFEAKNASFEYVFLHCPNGVFDLEDRLLRGNNALRSDEAIDAFLRYMEKLYRPGYWFTNYQGRLSPDFLRFCASFVDSLSPVAINDLGWYYLENKDTPVRRARWYFRRAAARLTGNRRPFGRTIVPLDHERMRCAYPTPEQFYAAARRFLADIFSAMGGDTQHLILDQLLLPHNLFRLDDYFDDDVRVFVVDRDPRDVFILNKYVWLPDGCPVPYPTDAAEFCRLYDGIRRSERHVDDPRVLRLHFEDLVYRYDETLPAIYAFLGVDGSQHAARRKTLLRPEISVNNTHLFTRDGRFRAEAELIGDRLSEYLYDFPQNAPSEPLAGQIF